MKKSSETKEIKKTKKDKRNFFYMLTAPLAGWLLFLIYRLKVVKGKNNIPPEGAFIAAGNHISGYDPIAKFFSQKRQLRYMAKAELFKIPVIRHVVKWYGAFPVERGTGDSGSIDKAVEILGEGKVLGIYPEGTRSKTGELGRFKTGVAMIAHKANVPIYPFAVYSNKKKVLPFCKYTVAFGDPVTPEELGIIEGTTKEYHAAANKLRDIVAELQAYCREVRG